MKYNMDKNIYIKPMTPTRRAELEEGCENAINELRGRNTYV